MVSQAGDVECCLQHADQNVVLNDSNISSNQRSTRHGKRDAPLANREAGTREQLDQQIQVVDYAL